MRYCGIYAGIYAASIEFVGLAAVCLLYNPIPPSPSSGGYFLDRLVRSGGNRGPVSERASLSDGAGLNQSPPLLCLHRVGVVKVTAYIIPLFIISSRASRAGQNSLDSD